MNSSRIYWRLVRQLPYYGGAVSMLFKKMLNEAAREEAEGIAPGIPTVAEPRAPLLPQHRLDRDDAPEAQTSMEREAHKRGEKVIEVPLSKMELMMGPGWFSHGTG